MPCLSTIASKLTTLAHLTQLHSRIIVSSLYNNNFCASLLITHSTRFHAPPSYARCIFDSVPIPNVVLYTNMCSFYLHCAAYYDAISLFVKMRRGGAVSMDAFVYLVVIKAAVEAGEGSVVVHAEVVKLGLGNDRFVRNAVMDGYAKMGKMDGARKVFDEMPERVVADWNAMISGYWKWGYEKEACELFGLMPERNVVSWTVMVTGFSKNGFKEMAMGLFDEMLRDGVMPDETTWVTVMSACSSRGDPSLAKVFVRTINESKIELNFFVRTGLVDMYAKCGKLEEAKRIFDELR
ncbi:hypothetical protein Droror1_Dr00027976, partial [Drosera rotundifolia]